MAKFNAVELGVNVDHVATVREARKTYEPDPVWAAVLAELGGADAITVHLREDRRHIQERDVRILRESVKARLNLEMACDSDVTRIACEIQPDQATLVPERREEVTTEGGLDLRFHRDIVARTIDSLQDQGILVSLFLDPDECQIDLAAQLSADAVELHTGAYASAELEKRGVELQRLIVASQKIVENRILLHAGHGLNYQNVRPIAGIPAMRELNIGHSIVSRAMFVGMQVAVREMKDLIRGFSNTLPGEMI